MRTELAPAPAAAALPVATRVPPTRRITVAPARRVVFYGVLSLLAVPFVFPTWWMIPSSFKPVGEIFAFPPTLWPANPTLQAYVDAFTLQPFAQQYFNSLYI